MKGDLGIDDNCKRGIGVRGRAEEPARGLKGRSTRKGAGTQEGFCEDAVRKQSVSFLVRFPNPLATGHSWQLGNLTTPSLLLA